MPARDCNRPSGYRALTGGSWLALLGVSCLAPDPSRPLDTRAEQASVESAPGTAAPAPALPGNLPDAPPAVASYTLRARLDAATHTVHGEGTLRWVNSSRTPTEELYFHLYLDAFANNQTLFQRSPFRRARGGEMPKQWGEIHIERLVAHELGDVDLLPRLEAHSPEDPLDGTDRRLPLPRAIASGETLTLDLSWTATLPELTERTGFKGDFHFVAQWFPKLARLEPDGTWAHFAFDPESEFYADFGSYDVTLDVPEEMVVGATGHRISESRVGARQFVRYQVDNVHDFAWTAWPGFRRREERMGNVDVHLLYPPGHERNADRTLQVLRRALPHFEAHYGSYPYRDLTVVHPPRKASNAGGMEYPTLITTGGDWHDGYWSRSVENVTVHEFGHQWFYGLLASNEHRWPFLDEGLNSYAQSVAMREFFGTATASDRLEVALSSDAVFRAFMLERPHDLPIALGAAEFPSFQNLGGVVYARTALLFETLANVYGEPQLTAALRDYALRYRFHHPTPDDLVGVLEADLGPSAGNNLRGALFQGQGVDYELSELGSAVLAAPRGHLPPGDAAPAESTPQVESRVVVNRHGELQFPVDVLLVTAAGEQIWRHWDGSGRFAIFRYQGRSPVVSAVVDPRNQIAIDDNLLDNAKNREPDTGSKTLEASLYATQLLLGWLQP
jgi:hypothetical protein